MLIYSTWSFLEGSVDTSSFAFVCYDPCHQPFTAKGVGGNLQIWAPPPKKKRAKNTKQFPQTAMKLRETSTHLNHLSLKSQKSPQ